MRILMHSFERRGKGAGYVVSGMSDVGPTR
jgi:hypothetical protein